MIKPKNPLMNKDFLLQLDNEKNREVFVRITSLNINEQPVERIEGKVSSGGSINVNGSSAVRRTCSLTLMAHLDTTITETLWALKTKFKLEVGLRNNIDPDYDDIIWFKQGTYVITSFSLSVSAAAINVSISGQDKMALLNGTLGGTFYSETVFDVIDDVDEQGNVTTTKMLVYDIIKNAVHTYGLEPYENIIINDIPDTGYDLWEYRGEQPMYILLKITNYKDLYDSQWNLQNIPITYYYNILFDQDIWVYSPDKTNPSKWQRTKISNLPDTYYYNYNSLFSGLQELARPIWFDEKNDAHFYVCRINYGELAGYHMTDLIYPGKNGSLAIPAGGNVVGLLDKIKSMLGAFEYFYDLDGRFIFQKQKNYTQGIATIKDENGNFVPNIQVTPYSYKFDESELLTNIAKSPDISKVKNDFVCWGTGKYTSGVDKPIHAVMSFGKRPTSYTTINGQTYNADSYDYREIIYQMAKDYYKYHQTNGFISKLIANNTKEYPKGITGYEPYYQEILGFWRTLYDPNPKEKDRDDFYSEGKYKHWYKKVITDPGSILFWFDIIDTGGELAQYNIQNIGRRSLVKNEKTVTTIGKKDTPEIVFVLPEEIDRTGTMEALQKIQIQEAHLDYFNTTSSGISAVEQLDTMISENIMGTEGLNLTCIPIYYLEPNTRIYIKNEEAKIDGDYIISQLTIPLSYNGTMSITTSKVIEKI